ncbi:3-hydroxyacyl-CoA dehydrogenase family protein [Sulfobacillus thermosulfidooxidans]|uniref:3-hydroxyacyl-CoA dehydrogenase family protein n=1 Tax=Sulfobacillus thermosulfidooxidans TaxID=28034 RepID=UPI00096B9607|nr:3-hydroxyacyl-CoA dehydrogenase NAD-binding domain-containing protein [Sulfobacillus thermosulfidooxidans]OLZ09832.1 3-hydroxybutyryl-CoA dehydrogenase [Sulfobacillus thermosulfidooxidans]OLZ15862.1 3-hydroxybutyryl-CoA dehydrogenase [Sulfobacillus thermosulfidooxidans]OLZ18291.1 3-hydroxybutyryl-CoA dehydrogenase [Sulfobacillus thermosulfidooxidans]
MEPIKTLGVVGAGTMGSGIAQLAAMHGIRVLLYDSQEGAINRALSKIRERLMRAAERGQVETARIDEMMSHIIESSLDDFVQADFVIEAVVEVMAVKKTVFEHLSRIVRSSTVLASNTSSFSITELASVCTRPETVVGMHFFNPAPIMKLVEIVRGEDTLETTIERAQLLAQQMGKETIVVQKDTPGFVVNRILMPLFIEAMRILEEGVASKEDIDKAVKLGLNHPMGPLTLADFTGLDVDLEVMDYLYNEFHDDRFAAPQVLRRLVRAGHLGKKSGRGFYHYSGK